MGDVTPIFPPSSPYAPFAPPSSPDWPNGQAPLLPSSFPDACGWRSGITRRVDPARNLPAVDPGWWIWFNSLADRWVRVVCAWCHVIAGSTAKNRSPGFAISDNAHQMFYYGTDGVVGPNVSTGIAFAPGHFNSMKPGPGSTVAVSIPDMWIPPGWAVSGGLLNHAPDDVCTEAHVLIQELPAYPSLPSNSDQPAQ